MSVRITAEQARAMGLDVPKRSKFRSAPTVVDGIRFDSRREARRYGELMALKRAGQVRMVLMQVPFVLTDCVLSDGRVTAPSKRYIADFVVIWESGRITVEDAKGVRTREYQIKRDLMRERWGIEIVEV